VVVWHKNSGGKMNSILDKPCCFCGYAGKGYFEAGTHAPQCPWFEIAGELTREAKMPKIVHQMFIDSLINKIKEANDEIKGREEKPGKSKVRSNKPGHGA
jgi:hypothetical protein